jgi:hypothetical protein
MKEPTEEQVAAFTEELTALSKKHGMLVVGACGCCGSPWVDYIDNCYDSVPDRIDLGLAPKEDPIPPFKMD